MAIAEKLRTKNGYLSGIQKGQPHLRARRTHERPGVARRPRLTIDQQYVRLESKKTMKVKENRCKTIEITYIN